MTWLPDDDIVSSSEPGARGRDAEDALSATSRYVRTADPDADGPRAAEFRAARFMLCEGPSQASGLREGWHMPGTDERVGLLEERMDDQVRATTDLRHSMELRFDGLDRRFDAMERRFDAMERRFEAVDRRFETVDRRLEGLDRKVDAVRVELDAKLSRGFVWLVGIQVTVLVAVIGALFGR